MKTIKQIADELGVSKQAIAKRVAKLPPTEVTTTNQGTKLISLAGIEFLRKSTTNHQPPTANQPPPTVGDGMVDFLQRQLEEKDRQLSAKDAQLAEKDIQIAKLGEALQTAQMLHADTKKLLPKRKLRILEAAAPPPMGGVRNIFARIFGKPK